MWNDYAIARALHVLAVLGWIGGVAFVTTVLIPAVRRRFAPEQQYEVFEDIEHRFGAQARFWVLLAGASGLYMLYTTHSWGRLTNTWWLHAMLLAWSVFFLMLFVLEPLLIHRLLRQRAARQPVATMRLLQRLHVLLLLISLLAVVGGVVGAHGGWRF